MGRGVLGGGGVGECACSCVQGRRDCSSRESLTSRERLKEMLPSPACGGLEKTAGGGVSGQARYHHR